jgi:toxin-antitoxin system PIN domain toxin
LALMLIDANLLLYASLEDFPQHQAAKAWLDPLLGGPRRIGLPWPSLLAFVRITTNPRLFERPLATDLAWKQVEAWLGCRSTWIPSPGDRHAEILGQLLTQSQASGNLVPDAHLAALAIEHGLTLCSRDQDFASFPGLNWLDPLA